MVEPAGPPPTTRTSQRKAASAAAGSAGEMGAARGRILQSALGAPQRPGGAAACPSIDESEF